MRYQVVLIKDDSGRESVLVYAVDRADALQAIPALFASPPILLGELEGELLLLSR